ncbi:MAG: hypothetical protein J6E41_02675 [Lachnospiraceae bacterium]|nr:hypothetical protein [Lachnospiraceae bacterium]
MLFYITLLLVFWALIYTIARFFQYFRIVKNYKEQTTAEIVRVNRHSPSDRREKPALDVVLEYEIDGKRGSSEVIVPADQAADYETGKTVEIRYYVSGNGAVHIASAGDGPRKLMYGYLAAIVIELVVYWLIWRILL